MCLRPLLGYSDRVGRFHWIGSYDSSSDGFRCRLKNAFSQGYSLAFGEFIDEHSFRNWVIFHERGEPLIVSCGKCEECRKDYARDWSWRIMYEASKHDDNCFVTLTYDDSRIENLDPSPEVKVVVKDHGALWSERRLTLQRKNLQDFIKRLRDRLGYDRKFKYYYCGEYGTEKQRPHYHVCFMGYRPDDLYEWSRSDSGYQLYRSSFLEEVWPFGDVVVGDLTEESACYTARYTMKKINGFTADYWIDQGLNPEFVGMSTKPAIGASYLVDHWDDLLDDSIIMKGHVIDLPRYYMKKLDDLAPDLAETIRNNRKKRVDLLNAVPSGTDLRKEDLNASKVQASKLRFPKENLK